MLSKIVLSTTIFLTSFSIGQNWKNYDTSDGLSNNVITGVVVGKNNVKWIATKKGISTFDGAKWKKYDTTNGLVSNAITSIAIDLYGNIWAGTEKKGACEFDGSKWTSFDSSDGLISNSVNCVAANLSGDIWFGTNRGVTLFNSDIVISYDTSKGLTRNTIRFIHVDKKGNVWFATDSAGVSVLRGSVWSAYNKYSGLSGDFINGISSDKYNNVWFATAGFGVCKFDGIKWINYTIEAGLEPPHIMGIVVGIENEMWIGVKDISCVQLLTKLGRFNGSSWDYYLPPRSIGAENCITAMCTDTTGDVWAGTQNGITMLVAASVIPTANKQMVNPVILSDFCAKTSLTKMVTISFYLQHSGKIEISLYTTSGRFIKTLHNGYLSAGKHHFQNSMGFLSAGMYLCRVKTGETASYNAKLILP